mmetsp:Transcript_9389/g.14315  ORF Transcript_9389/g.14315 Transcript_9389/m.14315 type:complete len:545 (+) Transcript_9389:1809-3443(+)
MIEWHVFLGFFTKRGRLRESEKLILQLNKKNKAAELALEEVSHASSMSDESFESKQYRLTREFKQKLVHKQNLVPKTGKGKYNVTVPVPFEFMNQEKGFSIRQKKVEQMVRERQNEEKRALSYEYKAKDVPQHVKDRNKLNKIMNSVEERKNEAKRLAMAKIKATEAPFKFYQKDLESMKKKKEAAELPPSMEEFVPFRAGKVPWEVRIQLYKRMVDDAKAERERRVKKNAELSLRLSKLPPRMEDYERRKREKETGQNDKAEDSALFEFKPPTPREVPDFKKLHKEFADKLERNKSASKLTVPRPFNFHEPKNDPSLRKHLDNDNQLINPTKTKLKRRRSASARLNLDLLTEAKPNPPTTKKHEAMVALRRSHQNKKLTDQADRQNDDIERAFKQVRLTRRVKKSPALSNNTLQLKRQRKESLQRAKEEMRKKEIIYNHQKAQMELKVAKRPLLVEQQTQVFIQVHNQIQGLQQYVQLLVSHNMDPNQHLTDEQKILLEKAKYFDELNMLAYFPEGQPLFNGESLLDENQQQHFYNLQDQSSN